MNPWRVAHVLVLMLPACVALVLVLLLLPAVIAFGCMLIGLVMFQVGSELGWKWSTVLGGACMFSGAFAWALTAVGQPAA